MTPKINLTIKVDAPTPEQFERYLTANGWTLDNELSCDQRGCWSKGYSEIDVPISYADRWYPSRSHNVIATLVSLTGKSELEVYNEIVSGKATE